MTTSYRNRLSPCSSGEDEGEGSERTRIGSTLTLPLSALHPFAIPGEATQQTCSHSKIFAQT